MVVLRGGTYIDKDEEEQSVRVDTYRGMRVMWSRVSKAADMSKAVRIVISPESIVSMISFVSLSKAVSVE